MLSQITLPARLENLRQCLEFITDYAEKQGFCPKRISQIELAAEEILVNVFNYAYPETEGEVKVIVGSERGSRMFIRFEDTGVGFDPLSAAAPDLNSDISERSIGGLGIFLAKKFMDQIHYCREKDRNILTLVAEPKAESEISL